MPAHEVVVGTRVHNSRVSRCGCSSFAATPALLLLLLKALQLSEVLNATEAQTQRLRQLMRALQLEDEVSMCASRRGRELTTSELRSAWFRRDLSSPCVLLLPDLLPPVLACQDVALAIAIANSLRDMARAEGELAELNQVC